jgi:RNA polymerase sigma-70 factor, ECF subfamily
VSAARLDLDEVLTAAVLGQAWALRAVYDELAPRVLGYLRARGARHPEDATSEVFLTVFSRLAGLTGGGAGLRTFTFSVAHARLVDDLRQQQRQPVTLPYDPERDGRRASSAADEAEERESGDRVRQILAVLPEDQRTVLTLRVVADLTVDEVAAAIGRSPGAVKQLQRRALLTLKGGLPDVE